MGIKSIKSPQCCEPQIPIGFTYRQMVGYRKNRNVEDAYEMLQEIGSGAEGQVFKARCRKTGNYRAIKKISKLTNQRGFQSICNQFNILKQLDHPNIVKIYQIYDSNQFSYMVSELCEGRELFQLIVEDKVIGEEKSFGLFYQLLTTINFLHMNNIMHRDIKPQNIIVSENLTAIKLIDLGTAVRFENQNLAIRKRIGTSYYIAPQVLKREYNHKCDIWSLGVILYILLSGLLPFQGVEDVDVLRLVESANVEYPHNKWKHISTSAKQTVRSMLQRDIQKRPSAQQLLNNQWIKQQISKMHKNSIKNQKLINSHLNNMKMFKVEIYLSISQQLASNPIQQGIFIFIVNFVQNSKTGQRQFLQTFKALDTNNDGVISLQQLTMGLKKYLKLPFKQCETISKKIFNKVDANNSGSIDYSQFVMSASSVQIVVTEQNIDLAFSYMDVDNSGKLSIKQIRQKLGESISEQAYQKLLKEFDKNMDGEISRYQFRDMMKVLVKAQKAQRNNSGGVKRQLSLNKTLTTNVRNINININNNSNINDSPVKHYHKHQQKLIKRSSLSKSIKR